MYPDYPLGEIKPLPPPLQDVLGNVISNGDGDGDGYAALHNIMRTDNRNLVNKVVYPVTPYEGSTATLNVRVHNNMVNHLKKETLRGWQYSK
jgi:hypothetical protein